MGMPPGEYQRALRLNAAKILLLDSEKSIEQIATQLGFEDPFHFSKAFKKNSGMNPRQYRAELRQGMWRE
jgi:transcriptional regulator GlxA family with amidase domain